MRIAVLGKRGSITGWSEATVAGLRSAGHEVIYCVTREPRISPGAEALLYAPALGAPLPRMLVRRIVAFRPELILAVRAFAVPIALLRALRARAARPAIVGWVGDAFDDSARAHAACFDLIGYASTALAARHARFGFASATCFLPHAVDPATFRPVGTERRDPMLVFVGSPTPHRAVIVRGVAAPLRLVGAGWDRYAGPPHRIEPYRIPPERVGPIYAEHAAVLNVLNDGSGLNGLNQRSFQPYLHGAAVLADDQPDLDLCFERGREVLVYSDVNELNELYLRLRREPELATSVAQAGGRRVLAEHGFAARVKRLVGLL